MTTLATARRIANSTKLNVTEKLFALFDLFGLGALCVDMAREAAAAVGLNSTSAEIAFYRWQAARVA